MKISGFTKILVLGGAAFLALSRGSIGRGGGHGGGGHFGGGRSGGFHGGRLPTASRGNRQAVQRPEASSRTRLVSHNEGFHGGRLPTASRASRQAVQRQPEASSRARLVSHNSGSQLPSFSRGESTVRNSTTGNAGAVTTNLTN
jgi:hypothetical protein